MRWTLIAATICVLLQTACAQQQHTASFTAVPYQLDRPDASFELPKALVEISGLTVLDDRHLAAVQDEKGSFYVLDFTTGKVVREEKFGKEGDYEGIERVGDRLFIVRSDGDLFEIPNWRTGPFDAEHHKTHLKEKCDAEGLAHQADQNRLLIACKEQPGADLKNHKAIYAFDLATRTLGKEPAYAIDVERFNANVKDDKAIDDRLRQSLSSLVDLSGFKPSALAFHPRSGELYVLSSVRKAIVVLDAAGAFVGGLAIPDDLFHQPEGMAFLPNGDLFISNEGGKRGTLLRFNQQ